MRLLTRLLILLLLLLSPFCVWSQGGYTSVTAIVADNTGVTYVNAPYSVSFYDPGTSGKLPLLNGSTFQTMYTGINTDSFGNLAISLPDNNVIASTSGATNTQWIFTISDQTNKCHAQVKLTITGTTQNISASLTAALPVLATCKGGGGGGGGNPAGNVGDVQVKATSTTFGAAHINDNNTTINVTEPVAIAASACISGPRPSIDVTCPPYNAKGDGITDDTASIQSAIAAACSAQIGSFNVWPEIIFPPGSYALTQKQLPSTTGIFLLPCSHLTFRGMGGANASQSGARVPAATIFVKTLGASPNNGPVFDVRYPGATSETTFINLEVIGYNQALSFYDTTNSVLQNVSLTASLGGPTGQPDNVPLVLSNVIWFEWDEGNCQSTSATNYCILMKGDTPLQSSPSEAPLGGLAHFTNIQGEGGVFHYDQRVNATGSGPGNIVFDNMRAWEGGNTPFFYVTNSTGNPGNVALPAFSNVTFSNVSTSDWVSSQPLVEFNSSGSILQGVIVDNSMGGNLRAIQMDAGSLKSCSVRGATNMTAFEVTDSTGNPTGPCLTMNTSGLESIVNETAEGLVNGAVLHSDLFSPYGFAPGVRVTASGNRFAGAALDAQQGLLLNTGSDFGFGASINQSTRGRLDISFPTLYPPTNIAGTPTTGGTLPAGTYYITLWGTGDSCGSLWSAPSLASSAITVSGGNNAISTTWTLPLTGTASLNGYCAVLSTTPNLSGGVWNPYGGAGAYTFLSGAGLTSHTFTSLPSTVGTPPITNSYGAAQQVTPFNFATRGFDNIYYVGGSVPWNGSDVGAQINSAIATCVATQSTCQIHNNSPFPASFTTAINLTGAANYVRIVGDFPCVVAGTLMGGCLNWTGTGAAINIDYVRASDQPTPPSHGLAYITLLDHGCITTGGCGGSDVGIQVGNTNSGDQGAAYDNVALYGFPIAYSNSNIAAVNQGWNNPTFGSNGQVFAITGGIVQKIDRGVFEGNGQIFNASTGACPELYFAHSNMYANTGSGYAFDFTNCTTPGYLEHDGVHQEDTQATNPHFVKGNLVYKSIGGLMEDDNSTGSGDQFVNLTSNNSDTIVIDGTSFYSPRPITQVFLLNGSTGGDLRPVNESPAFITNWLGGTGAAYVNLFPINANPATNPPPTWVFAGKLKTPNIQDTGLTPSSNICTDGSSNLTTVGCPTGVAPLTPISGVYVTGLLGGVLQTAQIGQCPGGSSNSTTYTYASSDRGCIVTRSSTSAMTDTLPAAGSGGPAPAGFTNNFYLSIANSSPTAADTITTGGTSLLCIPSSACSGLVITLPAQQVATIWSPDNVNWTAAVAGGNSGATSLATLNGGTAPSSQNYTFPSGDQLIVNGTFVVASGTITSPCTTNSPSSNQITLYGDNKNNLCAGTQSSSFIVPVANGSATSNAWTTNDVLEASNVGGFFSIKDTGVLFPDLALVGSSNSWVAGATQTFAPSSTASGLNVGSLAGNPSTLNNGDIWYNSTAGVFECRQGGATLPCIASSTSSPGSPSGSLQYNNGGVFAGATIGNGLVFSSGNLSAAPVGFTLSSQFTNSQATTFANLGPAMSVAANTNYQLACTFNWQTASTTNGIQIQFTGPASPTAVTYSMNAVFSAAGSNRAPATHAGFGTPLTPTYSSGTVNTDFPLYINLGLQNGTSSGSLQLQAMSTSTTQVTVQAGGGCTLTQTN